MAVFKKNLTREQALQKLRQFCGYQERCHSEVKGKLYDLGVKPALHDEIIATLIEENYLNEERFAIAYAGGKFRTKQWGRVKIAYALRQKQLSDYCINKALKQIDAEDYKKTIESIIRHRCGEQTERLDFTEIKKLKEYLYGRGYEGELVQEVLTGMKIQ